MFWIIIVFFTASALVVGSSFFVEKTEQKIGSLLFAIFFFGILVFIGGPQEFRQGHVPSQAEKYSKRLDSGVVYEVLWSSNRVNDEFALVVRPAGRKNDIETLRILHVKGSVPPSPFTLIDDDKPIAVISPLAPSDTTKK